MAHVAFTELGFYTRTIARTVAQRCACGLTAIRTSESWVATAKIDKSKWPTVNFLLEMHVSLESDILFLLVLQRTNDVVSAIKNYGNCKSS